MLVAQSLDAWLLEGGHVTQAQIDLAKREQARKQLPLDEVLLSMGMIDSTLLNNFRAQSTGSAVVALGGKLVSPEVFRRIPEKMARTLRVFAFELQGNTLSVAMKDPLDLSVIDRLEHITQSVIEPFVASDYEILKAIEAHYPKILSFEALAEKIITTGRESNTSFSQDAAPIVQLIDNLLLHSIFAGASDIHIHPEKSHVRLQMRIDGVLQELALLPRDVLSPLTTRIKILAGMDIGESRLPQDGRITCPVGVREVSIRASTRPTAHGESVVLRILDTSMLELSLRDLGFLDEKEAQLRELLQRPYGIILATGPTGSGKTTTLYAALRCIDATQNSIFTLEDPIEYRLPFIRQTQVHESIGLTFAEGLRNTLRQDPDVILVGEIRDTETAEMAVRAALTGHLVLSTLHTNDALGSISRLVNLGIEPYLLADTLIGLLAQRLTRRLCPHCRQPDKTAHEKLQKLGIDSSTTFWAPKGCNKCHQVGYAKRIGLIELAIVDAALKKAIYEGMTSSALLEYAQKHGFKTLLEDGIYKAAEGLTSLEEVLSVATTTS